MDNNGLYCSASKVSKSGGLVTASVKLSQPIDLSDGEYELGVLYVSMVPTWSIIPDLWFESQNNKGISSFMRLESIPNTAEDEVLQALSIQLQEKYGNNMKDAPIKITKEKTSGWILRIQKISDVQLSPGLSTILGQESMLYNETELNKDFPIVFKNLSTFVENSFYYVACDQCKQNYINSSGVASNMLDFVHIPRATSSSIVEHSASNVRYARLEGSLLHNISFSLYNYASEPVTSQSVDLFLLFHIRKVDNGSNQQHQ